VRFSQRIGVTPIKDRIQKDDIDAPLRNALWDALDICVWDKVQYGTYEEYLRKSNLNGLFVRYWHFFLHKTHDTMPWRLAEAQAAIKIMFMGWPWHTVYDFIEFTAQEMPDDLAGGFTKFCNRVFDDHLSAYRFVDGQLVQITNDEEIASVEEALNNSSPLAGVHAHLKTALDHLSDRKKPDFRNSIKESISAVESLAQVITGNADATLGQALKQFEGKAPIHGALKSALSSLYGWTSDAEGIRHAMLDESKLTFNEAKFMLVACTAFINFLIGKAADENITLKTPN